MLTVSGKYFDVHYILTQVATSIRLSTSPADTTVCSLMWEESISTVMRIKIVDRNRQYGNQATMNANRTVALVRIPRY